MSTTRVIRLFLAGLFIGLVLSTGLAQTPSMQKSQLLSPAPAEAVGMSSERLLRLDNVLQEGVNNSAVPGVAAIIVRDGRIVYHKAFGLADAQNRRNLRTDDIFRIASMTKAIVSAGWLMLYEEGKFMLDDPIHKWIPEFKNVQVLRTFSYRDTSYTTEAARSPITIRQLLNHTSGISYGLIAGDERFSAIYQKGGVVDLYTTDTVILGDNIRRLAALPLQHHPGEKYTYGENIDVVGYLIEIMSGQSLDQFLRNRVFEPLGMVDTYFYLPDGKANRLVPVQIPAGERQWTRLGTTFYNPDYPITGAKTFYSGGAGLSSTLKDYATFLQMVLNGGEYNGIRILSRPYAELLCCSNQTGDLYDASGRSFFSLAFGVVAPKGEDASGVSAGTFSWGGYFNTSYFADPKEKLIGVIMKQTQASSDDLSSKFQILTYQAIDN